MFSLVLLIWMSILPYLAFSQRHTISEMSSLDYCGPLTTQLSPKLSENIICTNRYYHNKTCPDNKGCACYFEVKGATDKANTDAGDGRGYRFSLETARKICDEYNATLPTIHDRNELDVNTVTFTKKCHNEATYIALGMTKVAGQPKVAEWDDGVDPNLFVFDQNNWIDGGESSDDTYTVAYANDSNFWRTFHQGEISPLKVYVFCKLEYTGTRKESSLTATTIDAHAGHVHGVGGSDATTPIADIHAGHVHGIDTTALVQEHETVTATPVIDVHAGHEHVIATATPVIDTHAGHQHEIATATQAGVIDVGQVGRDRGTGKTKPILREIDNGCGKVQLSSMLLFSGWFVLVVMTVM